MPKDLYGSIQGSDDGTMKAVVLIVSIMALPLFLLLNYILREFHASRCASNTFMIDTWRSGVPAVISVIFVGSLGASGVFAALFSSIGHDEKFKYWRNRAALLALLSAPLAAWAVPALFLDQYCLGDSGADIQTAPWVPMHHYSWDLADNVTVSCQLGKGGWIQRASIDFDHGNTLIFPAGNENYAWFNVYSRATSYLKGRPIIFNSAAVATDCPKRDQEVLVIR